MRHDQIHVACGGVERRVVGPQRRHQDPFDQHVCSPDRIHHARDRVAIVGIDHRARRVEVEAERLDERAIELGHRDPAFAPLTLNERLGSLPLCIERVKFLIKAFFGRFPGINGAPDDRLCLTHGRHGSFRPKK